MAIVFVFFTYSPLIKAFISGGANRPVCPRVISCTDPHTGEERYGVPGMQDGFCC